MGNETNTCSLEGAESDISEEFSKRRRGEVDGGSVFGRSLVAKEVDGLLLEELVTSELEGPLQEVTGSSWAKTGQESRGSFILNDLLESPNHASVVGFWIKLDSCLDAERHSIVSLG